MIEAPAQEIQEGHARLANSDDRLLWTGCQPCHQGCGQYPTKELAEPSELRDWQIAHGDVRKNREIAAETLAFMEAYGVRSTVMADRLRGCPHQEGIDYEGKYCPAPACAFWHVQARSTHKLVQ
jgi:hypothetical protein